MLAALDWRLLVFLTSSLKRSGVTAADGVTDARVDLSKSPTTSSPYSPGSASPARFVVGMISDSMSLQLRLERTQVPTYLLHRLITPLLIFIVHTKDNYRPTSTSRKPSALLVIT